MKWIEWIKTWGSFLLIVALVVIGAWNILLGISRISKSLWAEKSDVPCLKAGHRRFFKVSDLWY